MLNNEGEQEKKMTSYTRRLYHMQNEQIKYIESPRKQLSNPLLPFGTIQQRVGTNNVCRRVTILMNVASGILGIVLSCENYRPAPRSQTVTAEAQGLV